jgi:hypothetical protein
MVARTRPVLFLIYLFEILISRKPHKVAKGIIIIFKLMAQINMVNLCLIGIILIVIKVWCRCINGRHYFGYFQSPAGRILRQVALNNIMELLFTKIIDIKSCVTNGDNC